MYSTCLFCHASLGKNEAIEHFPVGRRLAFDAAKGRLWVICQGCGRWNLTPIEERWEAIEECERAFRDTRLRASTEHVGLARLREGTTLIRIGAPQRPELAAWRYGDQFGRRRRRHIMMSATVAAVAGGVIVAGPIMGLIGGGAVNLLNAGSLVRSFRPMARVTLNSKRFDLDRRALSRVQLRSHETFGYEMEMPYMLPWTTNALRASKPSVTLRGDDALQAARIILPRINASGGRANTVADAVTILESAGTAHELFAQTAAGPPGEELVWAVQRFVQIPFRNSDEAISALPAARRLALEMILHETDERRALEGELAVLEERWKEAEEIAAISDDMFLPSGIADRLRKFRES